ncbi:MAG: response regulator [Acidobacteriia bacterium]|nr:response regulator [Terriglobia bacterium]
MDAVEESPKQILIVEDEGLIAEEVKRKLERLGHRVPLIARSGKEAIEYARSVRFDLVLMDIRIKGDLDGIATAQALKDELQLPVVYLTAHSDPDTIGRAQCTEPFGYVLKPIADGNLASAVQIALYKGAMERRLRTSAAWLTTTLNSVGEGILATDTAGEIVFMNPVAEQLTGWRSTDARGRLLMDVLNLLEEGAPLPAKNPIFELQPGEIRPYILSANAGPKVPVEIECFENRSRDGLLGNILLVRNISARRELEGRAMQSQRMEAVATMAGGLAHEFNNQLTVILGYADGFCRRLAGRDAQEALEIKRAASVAASLTRQLLTVGQNQDVRFETLNINEVLSEIQPLLSQKIGKVCTLVTELGSPAGFVRCDRKQLKKVLLNLALHARGAMADGGELRIESATVELEGANQDQRNYRPGAYVRLRVSDTGPGMEKEALERIFEPFFATRRSGSGAGLGLAVVHSIVAQSGGYISAVSQLGQGTTFEILLPCVGRFLRMADLGCITAAEADSPPTILLIENEVSRRGEMHRHLEREGFHLLEAGNTEEAELIAETYHKPIHVLVAGSVLEGESGLQLAQRLSSCRPNMQMHILQGPFRPAELVNRIKALNWVNPEVGASNHNRA